MFYFTNDVPKYLNQIYSLLLLVMEYSRLNNFLLIFFSFKCTLPTLNKIWFDLMWYYTAYIVPMASVKHLTCIVLKYCKIPQYRTLPAWKIFSKTSTKSFARRIDITFVPSWSQPKLAPSWNKTPCYIAYHSKPIVPSVTVLWVLCVCTFYNIFIIWSYLCYTNW